MLDRERSASSIADPLMLNGTLAAGTLAVLVVQ
jgi:hypothetical protein